MDFVQNSTSINTSQIATYVSRELSRNGFDDEFDVESFSSTLNENFYVTSSNSLADYLHAMKLDNKISDNVYLLLYSLDKSVLNSSDEEIIETLLVFEDNLLLNTDLTELDRMFLSNFSSLTRSSINAMNYSTGERDWSNFVDCLNRKKWLLAGAASLTVLLLTVINKCAIFGWNPAAMTACWFATIGIIVATWLLFCGGALTKSGDDPAPPSTGPAGPVVCTDPICPIEFDFSMDNGFTCCTRLGVSIQAFGSNNYYMIEDDNDGECPPLWTFQNGPENTSYCFRKIIGSNDADPDNNPPRWSDFMWSQESDRVCVGAANCP